MMAKCDICGVDFEASRTNQKICRAEVCRKAYHAAYMRGWNSRNKDKKREWDRRYERNNRDKINAHCRAKYASDPRRREYLNRWIKDNPDKVAAYRAKAKDNQDPEVRRNSVRRRRAMKKNAKIGNFPTGWKKEMLADQWWVCAWPGCNEVDLHLDHVVPLSKGGPHSLDNFQFLCAHHNRKKSDKTDPWYDHRLESFKQKWLEAA